MVAKLTADGMNALEIGRALGVARSTIRTHLEVVRKKLGVHSRVEIAAWYARKERRKQMQRERVVVQTPYSGECARRIRIEPLGDDRVAVVIEEEEVPGDGFFENERARATVYVHDLLAAVSSRAGAEAEAPPGSRALS